MFVFGLFILLTFQNGQGIKDCMPDLADRCFADFYDGFIKGINCSQGPDICQYSSLQFCSDAQEALDCAKDIIDEDCLEKDGRTNFDSWMDSLRTVREFLCLQSPEVVKDMVNGMKTDVGCWNPFTFTSCVEEKTTITHVVNLLEVIKDQNQCNWVLMGLTVCNILSLQNNNTFCAKVSNNMNEVFHIFMQKSLCGSTYCSSGQQLSTSLIVYLILFHIFIKYISCN